MVCGGLVFLRAHGSMNGMNKSTRPSSRTLPPRLKKRQDFLAAAKGVFAPRPCVVVQMRARGDEAPAKVGFTATKRLGKAVARNRARRRLREAVRLLPPGLLQAGHDYVFIARDKTATCDFATLMQQVRSALAQLNAGKGHASRPRRARNRR